jgi:hypothetical protein
MSDQKDIENLTLDELIGLVKQMRFNQRRFKQSTSRREQVLKTLEPLESRVDELIALYYQRQQKLF